MTESPQTERFSFQAEIQQLLQILIHSLYTEREIFLRELVSNASDALNRIRLEMLTNGDVLDPDADLKISIVGDEDAGTLTITDTGVGMTRDEFIENLGTIAHSGAAGFLKQMQEADSAEGLSDVIGRFGVGFYSVFMVADEVTVTSRSYRPGETAWRWHSTGDENYDLQPADKADRGTEIVVKLKEDATEMARAYKIEQIIRQHSNFVSFPIYVNDNDTPTNQQQALWRVARSKIKDEDAHSFYRDMTLDFEPPLHWLHVATDAPVQLYAMLFIPSKAERNMFSSRQDDGLKLYSRKVLIDDYYKEALPPFFRFMQGVVDSEDLPLNVSRESVQRTPAMKRINKVLTGRLIGALEKLAKDDTDTYASFWKQFGLFIKEGVATDAEHRDKLFPLLRFRTSKTAGDSLSSLAEYVGRMHPKQDKIYFILGDDPTSVANSPHLDPLKKRGMEVLYLTDAYDSFMLIGLREFEGFALVNVAGADLELPDVDAADDPDLPDALTDEHSEALVARFKTQLGDRVADVRTTSVLVSSPLRLVDPEGSMNQEMQRVYRMLERDYEIPKKVLELNPRNSLLHRLAALPDDDPLAELLIEQLFESALLMEGLHPNPAAMTGRIQTLMEKAAGI